MLALAFSVLLSAITYLGATNQALNFLEQREAVNLTLQVAVAVGALLALLGRGRRHQRRARARHAREPAADARRAARAGRRQARSPRCRCGSAALAVTVPYVWFLGHDVGAVGDAIAAGLARRHAARGRPDGVRDRRQRRSPTRTASASRSACSCCSRSSRRRSCPAGAQHGWAGELLLRVNPVTAAEHYVGNVVVNQHGWTRDLGWLASPLVAAVALTVVAVAVVPRFLRLRGGVGG